MNTHDNSRIGKTETIGRKPSGTLRKNGTRERENVNKRTDKVYRLQSNDGNYRDATPPGNGRILYAYLERYDVPKYMWHCKRLSATRHTLKNTRMECSVYQNKTKDKNRDTKYIIGFINFNIIRYMMYLD